MQFNTLLFAGIILCISSTMDAQDLLLTSGKKIKTIKPGTFIEVELPSVIHDPCINCSDVMRGKMISYADGKLNLQVKQSGEPLVEGGNNIGYLYKNYNSKNIPTISILRENILSVTVKGKKKIRKRTTGEVVGMIISILGISHLVSAPIAELTEDGGGSVLLGLGIAETITGFILGPSLHQKTYYTNENCPQKRTGQKIWVLN
jgi:hypothetical protein